MKLFYGAGLNENQYPHPSEASSGSYNFDLQKDSNALRPRMPVDLKGTATNGADIRGLLQLIKRDNTETTLVQAGDRVYKWDGASTFSSVATLVTSTCQLRDAYWSLDDYIVCPDLTKAQPVMQWNGTTFTTHPTGLANPLKAKYAKVHQGRLWLANITESSTVLPHMIVASAFESAVSFDTTLRAPSGTVTNSTAAFYMLTPDLKPVNGMELFHNDLVISTVDGRLYRLTGSSTTDYAWADFYAKSNAIGNEAVVNTGNDLMYMRTGGNIESLIATQNYGDVSADDISRWIPNTVDGLTDAIAVYDQDKQKVLFFVSNKILVLYKDILYGGAVVNETGEKQRGLSPWSVYKTTLSTAFNTSAARYMRKPGETNYSVYFGDSAGKIYDLNGSGGSGDGGSNTVQVMRGTRFLEELGYLNKIPRGKVQYVRIAECDFNVQLQFSDEYSTSVATVKLKGGAGGAYYFGGANYFGGAVYFGSTGVGDRFLSHQTFSNVGRGKAVVCEVSSDTNVRYQVNHVELR